MKVGNYEIKEDITETKDAKFEIKADNKDLHFEGYANVFNNVDSQDDISAPGSFAKTLSEMGNKRGLFFAHRIDTDNLVGGVDANEDGIGLFVKGKLHNDEKGRKLYQQMKDKIITMMSIGFRVLQASWEERGEKLIRIIKEYKLHEVSILPQGMAANELSYITAVKSLNGIYELIKQNKGNKEFRQKVFSLFDIKPELIDTLCEPEIKPTLTKQPSEHLIEFHKFLTQGGFNA